MKKLAHRIIESNKKVIVAGRYRFTVSHISKFYRVDSCDFCCLKNEGICISNLVQSTNCISLLGIDGLVIEYEEI